MQPFSVLPITLIYGLLVEVAGCAIEESGGWCKDHDRLMLHISLSLLRKVVGNFSMAAVCAHF